MLLIDLWLAHIIKCICMIGLIFYPEKNVIYDFQGTEYTAGAWSSAHQPLNCLDKGRIQMQYQRR